MSTIFPYGEKDNSPKLIRFLKLLSRFERDEALRILPEFSHESYYSDLDRLLQQVMLITDLQNNIARERHINMRIKAQMVQLNNRLAQESLKHRPTSMTDHQHHFIQVATYLEANDFSRGQKLANMYKLGQLQRVIQELQEYRWLKIQVSRNSEQRTTSPPRFESLEGEGLRQLVENHSSRYISAISFFKSQFHKIIQNQALSEVPPHLFEEDFKKSYETFISKLRQMRNNFHDFQRPLKRKIFAFSRKIGLQMNESAELNKCVDQLFQRLDGLLEHPQKEKVFYRRSVSYMSDLSDGSESSISMSNDPSQIKVVNFQRKRQLIFTKSPQLIRLEDLYKIISRHLPTDNRFSGWSPQRKMTELLSKVKQLGNEVQRIKANDEQFIQSFQITENILKEFNQDESFLLEDHLPAELPNIKSTDEPTISQLKVDTDRLLRELNLARQNTASEKEYNARLIRKLKDYQTRENSININNYKNGNCQSTLASLKVENIALKESVEKLRQELQIKTSQINNFELSRNEDRKKFESEKQRLIDIEKAKLNKVRDDYDDLMDRLTNMNNLYEERFLINQKTPEPPSPHNTSSIKAKKERDHLKKEVMMLSGQNEVLKQQLNRETHQIAIGMSQDGSFLDQEEHQSSSESFIRHLNLQSKVVPPCNSEEIKIQIEEVERQNYQLNKQIEEKNISNIYMETNNRELRETIKTLSAQKEQLSSRLRTLQIRSVTHNEQNLPTLHLFPPGFIFQDHDYQERLFLLENLQSYTGPISRTRLIYRADPHNRTNFHKYIDKQRHVVAIFKTIYGKLIAGYSEEAFDAGGIIRGHGMLLSLWGRKAFELQEKRAISYDDYFLIFGNSELRIKTGEYRLFSNFGIANSYYNNRGEKVHSLLGEDKEREVDLSHFQVYALDLAS